MGRRLDTWPSGRTWVFQGTVAEDATAGTHVCTATLTPGTGNEMQVLYGYVKVGNTATAQIVTVNITDGTNNVGFIGPVALSGTTASLFYGFPVSINPINSASQPTMAANPSLIVSGTMQLVLSVTTAAVSVTQTFAVVCRIKGGLPTAVLADSVGTPVLTTNTSRTF